MSSFDSESCSVIGLPSASVHRSRYQKKMKHLQGDQQLLKARFFFSYLKSICSWYILAQEASAMPSSAAKSFSVGALR